MYVLWPIRSPYAAARFWITETGVYARWRGRFSARPSASARAASSSSRSASRHRQRRDDVGFGQVERVHAWPEPITLKSSLPWPAAM